MRNFKRIIKLILCLALVAVVVKGLDMALYPCTFMRNDVHRVATTPQDVLILGTSCGKMNINPDILLEETGLSGHNICVGGEYPVDAYYLLKLAIEKQNPRKVVYEVDPSYFMSEKEEGNNYLLFYHEFPLSEAKLEYFVTTLLDCDFRAALFPFYEYPLSYEFPKLGETFTKKLQRDYDADAFVSDTQRYHENGFIERYPVSKEKMKKTDPQLFERENIKKRNMEYLSKIILLCKEKNIEFTAVTTPLSEDMLEKYQKNYESAWDYFSSFFEKEGASYYNFNREYYGAYPHNMSQYTDYDGHMNGYNARDFSEVLGKIIEVRK